MELKELIIYGFTINFALMAFMWHSFNKRFDKIETELKELNNRVSRIEGVLYSKECCMLSHDQKTKKAS